MEYERLLKEAEELDVVIKEAHLITNKGLCKGNRIAISKTIKTNIEKYCVLAEELGHYKLTVGDITDQTKIENRRQEKRARNWGYEKLIDIISLVNAFNAGTRNRYEVAEYLNVTEEFLQEALEHYKEKYGLWYEVDGYLVCFEPLQVGRMFK